MAFKKLFNYPSPNSNEEFKWYSYEETNVRETKL